MDQKFYNYLNNEIQAIKEANTYKQERIICSPQSTGVVLQNGDEVINFCANNYLGLADNKDLINTAKQALDKYGYGAASVRFICGTQVPHRQLEACISQSLNMEETIVFPSCFDAYGGVFESLLGSVVGVLSVRRGGWVGRGV